MITNTKPTLAQAQLLADQLLDSDTPFIQAMRHGTMSVELYAPAKVDLQTPHLQDELYFIVAGTGVLWIDGVAHAFKPHDCLFVAAGVEHRFTDFSDDFKTWVVFWGAQGGENNA